MPTPRARVLSEPAAENIGEGGSSATTRFRRSSKHPTSARRRRAVPAAARDRGRLDIASPDAAEGGATDMVRRMVEAGW